MIWPAPVCPSLERVDSWAWLAAAQRGGGVMLVAGRDRAADRPGNQTQHRRQRCIPRHDGALPGPRPRNGSPVLCARIGEWMDQGWSPKLISLVLARDFPRGYEHAGQLRNNLSVPLCPNPGPLCKVLYRSLSLKRPRRRPLTTGHTAGRGQHFADAVTISHRPAEPRGPGGARSMGRDLIIGTGSESAFGTLVERSTRFTILLHLPERHTSEAAATSMIAFRRSYYQRIASSRTTCLVATDLAPHPGLEQRYRCLA